MSREQSSYETKAIWVLNVNGTLSATEGSGAVDGNGQVTGRLVVDANSIDTKNTGPQPPAAPVTGSRCGTAELESFVLLTVCSGWSSTPRPAMFPSDNATGLLNACCGERQRPLPRPPLKLLVRWDDWDVG